MKPGLELLQEVLLVAALSAFMNDLRHRALPVVRDVEVVADIGNERVFASLDREVLSHRDDADFASALVGPVTKLDDVLGVEMDGLELAATDDRLFDAMLTTPLKRSVGLTLEPCPLFDTVSIRLLYQGFAGIQAEDEVHARVSPLIEVGRQREVCIAAQEDALEARTLAKLNGAADHFYESRCLRALGPRRGG